MSHSHDIGILFTIVSTAIAVSTPLLLAAVGEIVVERAGVINVGIEGMMLSGAFAAYAAAHRLDSAACGAIGAVTAGILLAALFALVVLVYRADQVVTGTAINILALGITGVLTAQLGGFAFVPSFASKVLLRHGESAISADVLSLAALVAAIVVAMWLYGTRQGLTLRAVGEYPGAASDAGANVRAIRLGAVLFGGAMAGLAGACLSIGYNVGIGQGISSGRGFIALAVVIVGRWSPLGALPAALLFGIASALQAWCLAVNVPIPYQALLALPYLITLVALVIRSARHSGPMALGVNYEGR